MKNKILTIPLAVLGLSFSGLQAAAQDQPAVEEGSESERCISRKLIDRTEVLDDSNILFYMRTGVIYRNVLPHACPGLAYEDSFLYRTSVGQVCDIDIITVLDNAGWGYTPGITCGLGRFYAVTEEEAEALAASLEN